MPSVFVAQQVGGWGHATGTSYQSFSAAAPGKWKQRLPINSLWYCRPGHPRTGWSKYPLTENNYNWYRLSDLGFVLLQFISALMAIVIFLIQIDLGNKSLMGYSF